MELKITPSGQTIVKPTALGPGANTDTKLLIYGLFQKGRVLAQDAVLLLQVVGPVANTDTKLLIYGLFQKGRVLAQDGMLDADIRGFFDAIDHEWLMKFVEHRIADQRVLRHIKKWLNAGVMEDGKRTQAEKGTPQGGSVTPRTQKVTFNLSVW